MGLIRNRSMKCPGSAKGFRNLAVALCLTLAGVLSSPLLAAPVIVSLEFDDGTADQAQADAILSAHGMHATYYVNSGRIGKSGYFTLAQLQSLAANGNEIAGHTVSHANLLTLSPAEVQRQVCDDRVNLLGYGFDIYNFAFPFGNNDDTSEAIVQACGYNSGRDIGGIVTPTSCFGCSYAETLPPRDLWATRTPDSIKSNMTVADIQNYVLQAEQNGGGWVQLVMHHLCSGSSCDTLYSGYSVDPATLSSFLDWLQLHIVTTGSQVKTVYEVIGGALQPPVNGPPPTGMSLQNVGLEDPSTGALPTCWAFTNIKGTDGSFPNGVGTRTSDSHSGAQAFSISTTVMPTSGASQLYSAQDLGDCAPAVVVGDIYKMTAWYKTTSQVRLVAYLRDSQGTWKFWAQSPFLAASTTWAQAQWTMPAVPAGATGIAVAASLRSVGSLTVDDFTLIDTSDTTPPTVVMTSPSDGSTVGGTATLSADASDNAAITKVEFYVGNGLLQTVTNAPYTASWDTTPVADGTYIITAKAYDVGGNSTTSALISVTVSNLPPPPPPDLLAPTTSISCNTISCFSGWYTASLSVSFAASDNAGGSGVSSTRYTIDGTDPTPSTGTLYSSPFPISQTTTVKYRSFDNAGNAETVQTQVIQVDTLAPATNVSCNGANCSTGWYSSSVTVSLNASDGALGSGVASTRYTIDGTDPTASTGTVYSGPFPVSQTTTVKYRSFDNAGNAETVQTQVIQVDTLAPATSVSCNGASCSTGWYSSSVTVSLNASDGSLGSGVASTRYTIDGTDPTPSTGTLYSGAFSVSQTATVKYRSYDNAGNAEIVRAVSILIDSISPTASITQPSNGSTVSVKGTTKVSATATDTGGSRIKSVSFYLDGVLQATTTASPYSWQWNVKKSTLGTHALKVTAMDNAGNTGTSAVVNVNVH